MSSNLSLWCVFVIVIGKMQPLHAHTNIINKSLKMKYSEFINYLNYTTVCINIKTTKSSSRLNKFILLFK